MDNNPQSVSANGEENVGIPDDLRCKRSDGKQWRCTAMSMPDKTVCEKHYIQAKRRAANSALRASLKKAKRKSLGETDIYLESKNEEFDTAITSMKIEDYSPPMSTKKYKETSKNLAQYSPETPVRSSSMRNSLRPNEDDLQRDVEFEETWKSYKTPPLSAIDSSWSRSQRSFDASAMTEHSDGSTNSTKDAGGEICHQCRRIDRMRVFWCRRCDRRGFCDHCISTWYSDISPEEIEKVCPACRGICNCKACLRGDNMVKVRIREIPVLDKLQYLYCLLSSVLPVVKQIHQEQCFEVELEKKFHGTDIDLVRAKLNADEQMCCNICRIPIIDYHRHCGNCPYDMCLHCCQDLREASLHDAVEDQMAGGSQDKEAVSKQVKDIRARLCISDKYPGWKANPDGSIPCPPKEYGGCNHSSLKLSRIFKMNWVAKLVKNVEEMVTGCKVSNASTLSTSGFNDSTQCSYREHSDDNILYCPSSEDLKAEGINKFRKHWVKGEPVIVKKLFDSLSSPSWNPRVIWKGIQETSDEKMKDKNRVVKAIDFSNWSEVDIELGQFIEGYSEGRRGEDGSLQMLKLKDWPPPGASEEFLLYQRPDFISKLPLLEYIHSRLGLLNVAAKLPHYSLQNDAGPKIYISYGTNEELGRGDSVTNLHNKMRDMVYLLVNMHEVKPKGFEGNDSLNQDTISGEGRLPDLLPSGHGIQNNTKVPADKVEVMEEDQGVEIPTQVGEIKRVDDQEVEANNGNNDIERIKDQKLMKETRPGVHWDIFRRQDVPKLVKYLQKHTMDFGKPDNVTHSLYDGTSFLYGHHISKLKEEFGVEPWSFEQKLGEAVFVPAGCPFQMRNLQSTVLLALDFLSPESVGEAARLAEEIRCLPNDHETKLQVLEVGKISLYAASSAIKEVQKLVLDPKLSAEIGFEDPNLTAAVSDNLEKVSKQREISCS
ncbi:E3 ubiquitin-protein ligase JMJ24 [Mercurialis annua]|uniref:E3 ubiquitin-protein ligase JMJ24 n=1 Tax=Mercurialis annua TaxID=3986 RepID=UPI00215F80CE|nr:E3 ubiquitin-protein ligase JMJ24 [Mercurialis annua]